eukprot:3472370-Rhodomonas_salina.2
MQQLPHNRHPPFLSRALRLAALAPPPPPQRPSRPMPHRRLTLQPRGQAQGGRVRVVSGGAVGRCGRALLRLRPRHRLPVAPQPHPQRPARFNGRQRQAAAPAARPPRQPASSDSLSSRS